MWNYTRGMDLDNSMSPRKRPSGRRAGESGTRERILDAAGDLFAELGYEGASIRGIATAAGVDPALIRHFFGDKETLFATTVADHTAIPHRLAEAYSGDPERLGARVADVYLRLWEEEETRRFLLALLRSATTSERAASMLMEVLGARLRDPGQSPAAFGNVPPEGLALAASHLLGVAFTRHILKLPELAAMPHGELVEEIAPAIQRYLTGTPVAGLQ